MAIGGHTTLLTVKQNVLGIASAKHTQKEQEQTQFRNFGDSGLTKKVVVRVRLPKAYKTKNYSQGATM